MIMLDRLELQNMDHTIKNNVRYTGFAYTEEEGSTRNMMKTHY
jgi:hypothetical protein